VRWPRILVADSVARKVALFCLVVACGRVLADEPRAQPSPAQALATARERLDFGDYEAVVQTLRPVVEAGGAGLDAKEDRIEALRAYGIACALTGRRTAAEGAMALLLEEAPAIQFDPQLVRPEAVELLESVRARFTQRANRAPPPLPSRAPGAALMATGGVLAGVALVFVGLAVQAHNDYVATSVERTAAEAQSRLNVFQGLAIGFGAGGVIATGIGAGLWIRAMRARRAAHATARTATSLSLF
jgi:hypothetical protein